MLAAWQGIVNIPPNATIDTNQAIHNTITLLAMLTTLPDQGVDLRNEIDTLRIEIDTLTEERNTAKAATHMPCTELIEARSVANALARARSHHC